MKGGEGGEKCGFYKLIRDLDSDLLLKRIELAKMDLCSFSIICE